MNTEMKKDICLVGAGYWGSRIMSCLLRHERLGTIVDADKQRLLEHETINPYSLDYHSSLVPSFARQPRHSGYIIATPSSQHFILANRILTKRYPIWIEKPVCDNPLHAISLVQIAKMDNIPIMGGFTMLHHPAIQLMKKMLVDNAIGDLVYMYSHRCKWGTVRSDESVITNFASHDIAMMLYFMDGAMPKTHAQKLDILKEGRADIANIVMEFPKGERAYILVNWINPAKTNELVLVGTKGALRYKETLLENCLLHYRNKDMDIQDFLYPNKKDWPSSDVRAIMIPNGHPLNNEVEHFLD